MKQICISCSKEFEEKPNFTFQGWCGDCVLTDPLVRCFKVETEKDPTFEAFGTETSQPLNPFGKGLDLTWNYHWHRESKLEKADDFSDLPPLEDHRKKTLENVHAWDLADEEGVRIDSDNEEIEYMNSSGEDMEVDKDEIKMEDVPPA